MHCFHLPAHFVSDPSSLVEALTTANLNPELDPSNGWIDVHVGKHTVRITPRASRIFANITLEVDPDIKGGRGPDTYLAPVSSLLSTIGGQSAEGHFDAELDFVGRKFAHIDGVSALVEETRGHHANVTRNVAKGDFETAVYHRDLRDESFHRLIEICCFYD